MQNTESLKKNNEFKKLYNRGKSIVGPVLAVYYRKNKLGRNRLGITVSTKIGNAVVRNRVRRRIKEAYRLQENNFKVGFDIVFVARVKASYEPFIKIQSSMMELSKKIGLII